MTENPYAPPQHDAGERRAEWVFTGERDPERPDVLRYRYVPRLRPMLLAVVFFSVCLVFYVWRAWSNDRGLIINGLLELETAGATIFFATLGALSGGFVAIGLWALLVRLRGPSYLVLDEASLSIPSRFGGKPKVARYSTMRDVQLLTVQGQSMLQITTDGRTLTVASIMLASDEQLREVGEALAQRRKAASKRSNP
jgi:hypothetical protein